MSKKVKVEKNLFERAQPINNDFFNVPLLGIVRAGFPETSSGDYDLSDLISNFQNLDKQSITLEIMDNAMFKAGILQGDFLTVNLNSKPKNGDIVVVKLGERIFARKFYYHEDRFRLETADEYPTSLVVEANTPGFELIGKVSSITRQF